MKSPLTRFRCGDKDKRRQRRQHSDAAQLHDLTQAEQDMKDMRDWCERLLFAAATAANCTFELAEALEDLGTCFLQKAGLNDDEEIGRILLMLGKEQFALKKRLNDYRVHIVQTITTPSESLSKELTTVEEMKRKCDEKRLLLDHMIAVNKEKSKSKISHRESYSSRDLLIAQESYELDVNDFSFRLQSLKQGQLQSLLTQAVRHHSAQMHLFREGSKILESVEPHVDQIAAEQHIDCGFIEFEDDGSEDDSYSSFDFNDDNELSFDYGQAENGEEAISKPKHTVEEILAHTQPASLLFTNGHKPVSQTAPIYFDGKFDPAEKLKELHAPLRRKSQAYVLPTPTNSGNLKSTAPDTAPLVQGRKTGEKQLGHSSYLETHNATKISVLSFSDTALPLKDSVLREHNRNNTKITGISPPLIPGYSQCKSQMNSGSKVMRHAFSGPLTSTAWSGKLRQSTPSNEYSPASCTKNVQVPRQHTSKSPRASPSASPPLATSPKICELHALPRPPLKSVKSSNIILHSAPLIATGRGLEGFTAGKFSVSSKPSPLPMPPGALVRSFSIPSSSQRMSPAAGARVSVARAGNIFEDVASPPLSPIALLSIGPVQKTR